MPRPSWDTVCTQEPKMHIIHIIYIYVYQGVFFCHKCGAMTVGHLLNNLARPCVPPTTWGLRNLAALKAGKLPPKLTRWPDPSTLYQGLSPAEAQVLDNINRQIDDFKPFPAASSPSREIAHNLEVTPRHNMDDPDCDINLGSDSSSDYLDWPPG